MVYKTSTTGKMRRIGITSNTSNTGSMGSEPESADSISLLHI
jgi:hypothetical protein